MRLNEIKFAIRQLVNRLKARFSEPVWIRIGKGGEIKIIGEEYVILKPKKKKKEVKKEENE